MKGIRFELPILPYESDALAPAISQTIMELHHDKHHLKYVEGANAALSLLEDAREAAADINIRAVLKEFSFNFNGHMLHSIFWNNMRKYDENNVITKDVEDELVKHFGSVESFVKEFESTALNVEGGGWAMLCKDMDGNLMITQIQSHNLYVALGHIPVLVLDVWEHAYYIDYQTDKAGYIKNWWSVVNWDDVMSRIKG